jgi:glycosyltransferase involved in cell wall biosynthesis
MGLVCDKQRMKITVVAIVCDLSEVAEYRELASRGHQLHLFHNSSWVPGDAFEGSSVTLSELSVSHRFDYRASQALRKELRQDPPELLYAPYNKTLAVSLRATRGLPIKVVGYRGTMGHLSHWDPASRITYFHPRLAGIVCLSKAVEGYLRKMRAKARLLTAYKGFDVAWYTSAPPADLAEFDLPEKAFVLGFTGNVRPVKGVDILLRALAELPGNSRIHLLLVGQVRDKKVQRMLEKPVYSARVCQTGFRQDACQLTGACDAFVMPSIKREGLCRAVVEAMSQTVPPVVSGVGGMPELVQHGVSGLVVPPSDPAALAKALYAMEQDAPARKRMGAAAHARVRDRFSVEKATGAMESLFGSVLDTVARQD